MQVVFVHGVNTRDLGDGDYQRWVDGRTDRLNRLAFEGKAEIRNSYWGKFGLSAKTLKAIPGPERTVSPLGNEAPTSPAGPHPVVAAARKSVV